MPLIHFISIIEVASSWHDFALSDN